MITPARPTRSIGLLICLAICTALAGCDSHPEFVLDSDIPQVPGMEQRLGFDIKRSGGNIIGGVFIFVGPIRETEKTMRALASRFKDSGWSVERETPGFPRSALVFKKDDRLVEVVLDADQLEPAMSKAQYVVSGKEDSAAKSDPSTDAPG